MKMTLFDAFWRRQELTDRVRAVTAELDTSLLRLTQAVDDLSIKRKVIVSYERKAK